MRTLKTGIIGGGFIGAQHIEALRRLGYVDVSAVADASLDRARANADQFNIKRAYGSYAELLADPEIDAIHNCTPNMLHYAINRAALEAGKNVISEKPLAMNSEETASLVHIARQSGRLAAVNFNHRGYPMVQQARAMIGAGQLGKVQLIHGSYLQDWLLYATDWNWRLDPAVGGASRAMADIGSHWADLLQHVTGQRIVRVFADLQTVIPQRKRPVTATRTYSSTPQDASTEDVTITTEDYGAVIFESEGGAHGVFSVSQVSAGHKNRLSFEINGSKASASWDANAPNDLWVGYRNQSNELLAKDPALLLPAAASYTHLPGGHAEGWPDALKNIFSEMYGAILKGRTEPEATDAFAIFQDGHRSALLVDAILESARRGAWVDVQQWEIRM
ncbi:MAG: Gfo/Idh/MocA family oxidoreductase [Herpetosiphon sp.]